MATADDPYRTPDTIPEAVGVLSGSREDLRGVAMYQKGILWCIVAYLLGTVALLAAPLEFRIFIPLALLGAVLCGAVFTFLLSVKVYGVVLGMLMGFLTLVPMIGLLVLLMINNKATRVMKANGIKVGLFGANVESI